MPEHVFLEHLEPFFALAAADDFANARDEQIHRCDRLVIVIQTHVERLNLFRIIENRNRTFEMFLGQPTLVFGLQIQSVIDRKFKFLAALLEKIDSIRVSHSLKRPIQHEIESREQFLVYEFRE